MRTSSGLNPKPRTIKSNENFDRISNCSNGSYISVKGQHNHLMEPGYRLEFLQ